jgi:hypothetical protein
MPEQNLEKCNKTVILKRALKKRILTVGDSYTKGMKTEMQHNLGKNYAVQGTVRKGANFASNLCSNLKEGMNLTKEDFLTIWGCAKEVNRNGIQKGISSIQKYMQLNLNTNIIVPSLCKRRDLEDQSHVSKKS